MEMSKGDFAKEISVSAARVSQYIKDGVIDGDALVGQGRFARINVAVAKQQIAARRHVGQALGNGLTTRVDDEDGEQLQLGGASPLKVEKTADLIQLERLEQERRRNRRETVEEAERLRRLVPVDELERQVRRAAGDTVQLFLGMAPDIAAEISAQFPNAPARDLQHIIIRVMNAKRAVKAAEISARAEELPETKDIVLVTA